MSVPTAYTKGNLVETKTATVNDCLIVKKKTTLKCNLSVDGYVTIGNSANTNPSKKLEVNGQSDFNGTANFNSFATMSKTPTENFHLVNKAYVDNKLNGLHTSITNLSLGSNLITEPILPESILDKNNIWIGTNNYTNYLPTSSLTPTTPNHFANKEYVDSISGPSLLPSNNTWTGTNSYNTFLPTSLLTPSVPNQLTTKEYVDRLVSQTNLLITDNIWQGTNNFNQLPTSSATVSLNNQLTTKEYVDSLLGGTDLLITDNIWYGTNNFNQLPTSSANVTMNNHLTTKEYVDNAIASFTGSSITVSPGSANNYLTFVTGTSGNQSLYVDTGIMYNATTDTLTVVNATITGNCDATVTSAINANNINITSTTSTDTSCSVLLVGNPATGNQPVFVDTGLTYNANGDTLTVSMVNGDLNGTAENANNIFIRSTTSSDTTCSVVLVGNQATGNQQPFIGGGLMYNANTDNLTASSFSGNLIGNVTGAVLATSVKVGSSNGSNISQILLGTGILTSAGGGTNVINSGTIGLTTSSKIFVTFTISPANITWFYVTPDRDQFIITASGAPTNDATFNWIAYN